MNSPNHGFKSGEEGKGSAGCIFAAFLMVVVVFLAFKLAPPYINHYEFKNEMKQEVSRAGARSMPDENIKRNLITTAAKSNIPLKNENINIRRFSNQITIRVEYTIPVDLLITKRDLHFQAEGSSFTL